MKDWPEDFPALEPAFERDLQKISGWLNRLSAVGLFVFVVALLTATGLAYAGSIDLPTGLMEIFDFSDMYAGGAGSGHDAAGAFVGGY